jgi:UDP-glucose 4-epimerase
VLDRHDGIAVTGGLGFIGRNLVWALREGRKRVIVLDRRHPPTEGGADHSIEYRVVDIREPRSLRQALNGADLVFHLAANANGTYSVEHPGEDFQTNCVGTFNVLQAAVEAGVRRVVYVSSASVYGRPRRFPIGESHPTDPILPYGASKLAGERFGLAFWHSYGLDFVAARPFCVYGPGEDPATSLVEVSRYLRWHLNDRPIQVVGDARRKTRDFVHVSDAVRGLLAVAERAQPEEVLNVGSGTEVSMLKLVERIRQVAGGTVRVRELPAIADDTYRLVADISRLRALGYAPRVALDEGIAGLIEDLGDRPELPTGATIFRRGQEAEDE